MAYATREFGARAMYDEEFRAWFRDLLARHEMGDTEAAFRIGVHPATIREWRIGRVKSASYSSLVAICRLFQELPPSLAEVCPDGLDTGEGDEAPGDDNGGIAGGRPRPLPR